MSKVETHIEREHLREDLRNNLDGMSFYIQSLNKWLPHLLDAYQQAQAANLPVKKMSPITLISFTNSCNNMLHQSYAAQQLLSKL